MALKKILTFACFLLSLAAAASSCSDHENFSASNIQVPAPAPAPDVTAQCSDIVYDMMDCISYLSDGSTTDKPVDTCCSGAQSVLDFNVECVCLAIDESSQFGVALNMTRVQSLTSVCGIKGFSLDSCGSMSSPPGSSPSLSPVEPPSVSEEPPAPSPVQTPEPVQAPAPAPDQGASCYNVIYNMMDCIDYLNKVSLATRPNDVCCQGFESVMDFDGQCVCVAIESSSSLGIDLNMTRVDELPSFCGTKRYPLKNCKIDEENPGSSPNPPNPPPTKPKSSAPKPPTAAPRSSAGRSRISGAFVSTIALALASVFI